MDVRTRLAAASVAALFLACSGAAYGQKARGPAQTTDLTSAHPLTDAQVGQTRAHVNPATTPDVSEAFAEVDDGLDVRGVMTDDGPADDFAFAPRAFGTFGIPYTATRVQEGNRSTPAPAANRLSTTFPYRTAGQLTFRVGAFIAQCTATVIRRGVVVTAAHCVQDFGTFGNVFSNFQFRPGHYGAVGATAQQIAPYGTWGLFRVTRARSWATGTDIGCGAARENDLAVLAVRRDSLGRFVGDVVGQLGYGWNNFSFVSSPRTGNLLTAAVTTLGYPSLLDDGRIMQRTDGPTYTTTMCDAPLLWQGSNFTSGASGGAWVVNFSGRNAVLSDGAMVGSQSIMAVIGVTSFGSTDPNVPKDNFSSQFAQNSQFPAPDYGGFGAGNIGALLDGLCATTAPEGGTLESQGYCD